MAVVGNLSTFLSVNSSQLGPGLGKAGAMFSGFGGKLTGLLSSLGPVAAGLTGIVAAVKSIGAVGNAFTEIDRIAKAAQQFSITTEHMVGLEHAAELSGVSIAQLGPAMQRAARNGTSLEEVADRIAATTDATERAKIAYDALGRSGQNLIPLLAGGADAMRDMVAEGVKLAGFSGVDAAKIEEANDAISRMKLSFTGVARDLAIAVAPAVEKLAVGVRRVGEFIRVSIGPAIDSIKPYVVLAADIALATFRWLAALRPIAPAIVTVAAAMKAVVLVQKAVAAGQAAILALSGPKGWAVLAAAAAIGVTAYAGVSRQFDSLTASADTAVLSVGGLNTEIADAPGELAPAVASYGDFQSKLHDVYDEINALSTGGGVDHFREMLDITRQIKPFKLLGDGEVQTLKDALLQVRDLKKVQADRVAAEAEAARLTDDRQKRVESLLDSLKTPADKVADRIAEIADLFQNSLLTVDQASALSAEARKELTPDDKPLADLQGPAALQRGSSEAFSAVLAAMRGGNKDPTVEVAKTSKEQLAEAKRQTALLRNQRPIELVAGSI